MKRLSIFWMIFTCFVSFSPYLSAQGQTPATTTFVKLDELEKLLSANQLEVVLDYHSKNPTAKWLKIYSAEFCKERLRGTEQTEALRARKLAESLFAQLKSYQSKLKNMPVDEFAKSVNKLLDLRDSLSEPGYGNMVLQLCIERIVTLRIAERVVIRNEDLKVLEALMHRNNKWKHEWRTVCQMIEEEEGAKRFDYAAMEKMRKSELYASANLAWADKHQEPVEDPKLLFKMYNLGKLLDRDHREEMTIQGVLQKRSFNGFLHALFVEECEGRSFLPGLILYKTRGGIFKERWKDDFDKKMTDYVSKIDLVREDLDSDYFAQLVEVSKTVASGSEGPFRFGMSWSPSKQKK